MIKRDVGFFDTSQVPSYMGGFSTTFHAENYQTTSAGLRMQWQWHEDTPPPHERETCPPKLFMLIPLISLLG